MPIGFLTEAERARLNRFPDALTDVDIVQYFTLTPADRACLPVQTTAANQLGFAVQIGALRLLGYFPDEVTQAPVQVVEFVAQQLGLAAPLLAGYGGRDQTRSDHQRRIQQHLGFSTVTPQDSQTLLAWLVERALEHDRPTVLLQLLCDRLRCQRWVRPGITTLERWVVTARQQAHQEVYRRLEPLLDAPTRAQLDALLVATTTHARTPRIWLRRAAATNSPTAILNTLRKIQFCRDHGVERWDVSVLPPNRQKFLAQLTRHATTLSLQRLAPLRRYPALLAFLHQTLVDAIDETLDLFDRCLTEIEARARRELEVFRQQVARATNEKVGLFRTLGQVVLDPAIADGELRQAIYQQIPPTVLEAAVAETDQIIRPVDDRGLDFLARRYSYLRQFIPLLLATIPFRSHRPEHPLLKAIGLLRRLNQEQRRALPAKVGLDFVPSTWRPYVVSGGHIDRHYYELCVLWQLKAALRAGDLWVEGSRRYADPETYLIPREHWPARRNDVYQQLGLPDAPLARLEEREQQLEACLERVEQLLDHPNEQLRIEQDQLILSPLVAEARPASVQVLEHAIAQRLPQVELSELMMEVDRWTHFSECFEHAGGYQAPNPKLNPYLYAAVMADGCNLGLSRISRIATLEYHTLLWTAAWYLREETLKAAVVPLVNFQYRQPLSHYWGGGTLSSSDGQRFPVAGKIANATALPRYFGYGRGVTFYTWTSDQFSQYGTKVIPATVRDATYVLDEILDNETELALVEHTTDTAGYTEMVFALFDLLGLQFSPRIRDLGDQRLYRVGNPSPSRHLGHRFKSKLNYPLMVQHWDELLRLAGSLKLGWVTASLLLGKLQAYPRQNPLARALQEYGKLIKTLFILRYLESEALRRRINTQLNKGEALHALRRFLVIAHEGTLRRKDEDNQQNQAGCLNLLTNAVVVWNTVYMQAAIAQLRQEGFPVHDEDLAHLSPARYEHINPYGKYSFILELEPDQLRPLRQS
jgi:TnpA family transposase